MIFNSRCRSKRFRISLPQASAFLFSFFKYKSCVTITLCSRDGLIADIGYDDVMELKYKDHIVEQIIDASGRTVLPGLVDAHTHPVWAGDRVHEFSMKVH